MTSDIVFISCELGGTPALNLSHQPTWPWKILPFSLSSEQSLSVTGSVLNPSGQTFGKNPEKEKLLISAYLREIVPSLDFKFFRVYSLDSIAH